eukprot:5730716-Amphidinium_carterae.3
MGKQSRLQQIISRTKCNKCGQVGHWQRECPMNRAPRVASGSQGQGAASSRPMASFFICQAQGETPQDTFFHMSDVYFQDSSVSDETKVVCVSKNMAELAEKTDVCVTKNMAELAEKTDVCVTKNMAELAEKMEVCVTKNMAELAETKVVCATENMADLADKTVDHDVRTHHGIWFPSLDLLVIWAMDF